MTKRCDGRQADEMRPIHFTPGFLTHPLGSVLAEVGGTRVICAATCEPKVPGWMKVQRVFGGWLTCEYGLLPAATHERVKREASSGKQSGRTVEIQRLIGRSLRAVVDMNAIEGHTFYLDCDVMDADGGTRCTGISGAAVALRLAFASDWAKKAFRTNPFKELVAAVSVGMVNGVPVLDLNYQEDSHADVDMNVVMTESGKFVEIQGTAEGEAFSRKQMNELLDLAEHGLRQIFKRQNAAIEAALAPEKSRAPRTGNLGSLGSLLDSQNL